MTEEIAGVFRVLLVVRHPVGGIRTFFRYVYRNFDPGLFRFTLLAPDLQETRVLLEDLRELDIEYLRLGPSSGNAALFRQVSAALFQREFDLVHSHGFTSTLCSAPGALLRRVPHVTTCHDVFTAAQFAGIDGWARKRALTAALRTAQAIHCVTSAARDNLLHHLPALRPACPRISVVPNGIDSSHFREAGRRDLRSDLGLPPDSFLIGFFGRYMSQKGFRYLIDALQRLESDRGLPKRPFVVSFGGANAFFREEQARVRQMGLADRVLFQPFLPDIAPSLKGVDLVAMPSLWEACGLLAMEALTAGVPLVGAGCDGLAEVLADTPAVVVAPGDSSELSQAIRQEMLAPTTALAQAFAPVAATRFEVRDRALALQQMLLAVLSSRASARSLAGADK